jgi:hypothetical protein
MIHQVDFIAQLMAHPVDGIVFSYWSKNPLTTLNPLLPSKEFTFTLVTMNLHISILEAFHAGLKWARRSLWSYQYTPWATSYCFDQTDGHSGLLSIG